MKMMKSMGKTGNLKRTMTRMKMLPPMQPKG